MSLGVKAVRPQPLGLVLNEEAEFLKESGHVALDVYEILFAAST